jgi:exopolyphosphatase/guanosine-5'-triphosphate,3'-diphosphate pyrophosphatase
MRSTETHRLSASRPIAAIDIGSNSVFLLVVRVVDGRPQILHRYKDRARLAAAMDEQGMLRPEAVDRVLRTMHRFRRTADGYDAEVRAVATAAVRAAGNGADLLARIASEAGIDVEMVTGEREAELVYLGVRHSGRIRGHRLLCVDVGGGSTEVVLGSGAQVLLRASAHVGAVSLCDRELGLPPIPPDRLAAARAHARARIRPLVSRFESRSWDRAIATSGTIQRIARIIATRQGNGDQSGIDGMIISAGALDKVTDALARCPDMAARLAIPGMDPQRADILLGGALVFQELGRGLGIRRWVVSKAGLRMGIVADVLLRRGQVQLAGL